MNSNVQAPQLTTTRFRMGEFEPLVWLISILFTEEYWDRDALTRGIYNFGDITQQTSEDEGNKEACFRDIDAVYKAAEVFVTSNESAQACMDKVKAAMTAGTLAYHSPSPDKWGEIPYHRPEYEIDSFKFLNWASQQGYTISQPILNSAAIVISLSHTRKRAAEFEAHTYPRITQEDFDRLRKEPLWEVNTGILYLLGRRSRLAGNEAGYKGDNGLFDDLVGYALDSYRAKQLRLITEAEGSTTMKGAPADLIAWAETLPVTLPMINPVPSPIEASASGNRPDYCTPDMALMYDAVKKFWAEYDLANPNPSVAPMKKEVVAWLLEEAKRRGVVLSKTRAEIMDTIIRCPEARKGGNSL